MTEPNPTPLSDHKITDNPKNGFISAEPTTRFNNDIPANEPKTMRELIDRNHDLPQNVKAVFYKFDRFVAFWSLQNVQPRIVRWLLLPFAFPILMVGCCYYGIRIPYETMNPRGTPTN